MPKIRFWAYSEANQNVLRFDGVASRYDFERAAIGYRIRHALIRRLLLEVGTRRSLALDIGCGTGEYALLMKRMGFTVAGIDLSRGMLHEAKSKTGEACASDQPQLVRSECSRLPFKDGLFDVAVCISVLDLIPFYNKILHEIYRTLNYGGKLILCIDSLWSPTLICTAVRRFLHRGIGRHASPALHHRNLTKSLRSQGFVIERFYGDFLLGQLLNPFLFDPRRRDVARKMLRVFEPIDSYLTRISLFKPLSAHYIVQARKRDEEHQPQLPWS